MEHGAVLADEGEQGHGGAQFLGVGTSEDGYGIIRFQLQQRLADLRQAGGQDGMSKVGPSLVQIFDAVYVRHGAVSQAS